MSEFRIIYDGDVQPPVLLKGRCPDGYAIDSTQSAVTTFARRYTERHGHAPTGVIRACYVTGDYVGDWTAWRVEQCVAYVARPITEENDDGS